MSTSVYKIIRDHRSDLASHITQLHFEQNPDLLNRYGQIGKERCYEDAIYHLDFLIEALIMDHREMYGNYILWASAMLKHRNIPTSDLENNLNYLLQAIEDIICTDALMKVKPFVDYAREQLTRNVPEEHSYITEENPLKSEAKLYLDFLLDGEREQARAIINDLVQKDTNIRDIYENIFQPTQYEVGHLWQCNKISVAHEHYCTAATQLIMSGLYPYIFSAHRVDKTMVACSISGELHEMGIRMVTDFFEMEGWDTYYLGANMPNRQLQEAVIDHNADVLAISATLPTHISKAAALIEQVKSNPELSELKILVGGYPFLQHPDLWKQINADGFAKNANQAIAVAEQLTGTK